MLCFDIRSLGHHAVLVDATLSPDDAIWQDADPRPSRPLRVVGRLSAAGPGRYYWHGRIEGEITMACRRCLNDAGASVTSDEHVIFVEADDEEADNPDVVPLDPRAEEIDLRPAVREQWLLNVPAFALCRDDCKGLCATCGADLNAGPCSCLTQHAVDPRWDVLRKLGSSLTEDERATGRSGTSRTSAKQKRKN